MYKTFSVDWGILKGKADRRRVDFLIVNFQKKISIPHYVPSLKPCRLLTTRLRILLTLPTLPPLPRLSPAQASAAWKACHAEASDDARYPPVEPVYSRYGIMEEIHAARRRGQGDESMILPFCGLASNQGSRGPFSLCPYLPFLFRLPKFPDLCLNFGESWVVLWRCQG